MKFITIIILLISISSIAVPLRTIVEDLQIQVDSMADMVEYIMLNQVDDQKEYKQIVIKHEEASSKIAVLDDKALLSRLLEALMGVGVAGIGLGKAFSFLKSKGISIRFNGNNRQPPDGFNR